MEKREIKLHKDLSRQIQMTQDREKANMLNSGDNSSVNKNGAISSGSSFSADTAQRIQQSKINRADREVRKKAEKRLEAGREEIQKTVDSEMAEKRRKHYEKIVEKQVKELKRVKDKYMLWNQIV